MRHELKYVLTPLQYAILQNRLKWVLKPDANASATGEYFIRSIYFDSPTRKALREKLSGVNKRKKYRIRFYNGNAGRCMLECKEKTGSRIQKTSQLLTEQQLQELLSGHVKELTGEDCLLRELQVLIQSEGFAPAVTVDYVREAYVLPLSDLRITFDKEIAWGPTNECLTHERYLSNIYGENMVLEVKYNEYLPKHISAMIASVAPVQTAASKYVACVESQYEMLGY